MSALLRLVNIHKAYRMGPEIVPVLHGVNLEVEEGEFVAIMGASGSGKSTLLHIAGVLDRADPEAAEVDEVAVGANVEGKRNGGAVRMVPLRTPGEVYFRDSRGAAGDMVAVSQMGTLGRHRLRNTAFGFVFQFYHLLPELNVVENVLLPAMVEAPFYRAFFGGRPRMAEALRLLETFGLGHRLKHRPGQLSGGERQRVAIARALINQPALLLADEPTGNLDAKTGRTILDVFVKLHKEGQTILLVTHDPHVAALADRTVELVDGRIRE
jgi:ABC-type lipoprotein export system ATPase subunit